MEHSQHHASDDIPARLSKAGVHVVANPLHLLPDKRVLEARLGKERSGSGRSYPLQSMQKVWGPHTNMMFSAHAILR